MTQVRSKPEPQHWKHAAEIVPLAAGGLFAAVALARMTGLAWWVIPACALFASAAAVLGTAAVTGHGVPVSYAVACGVTGTGWSLYAALAGAWSVPGVASLLLPTVFLGLLYPVVRGHHQHAVEEARRQAEAARRLAEARKWPELFGRVGAKGVAVADSQETRAGHTMRLRLPATGKVTFSKLERLAEPLEVAARLRDGSIRFERGDHAGEVLMHVSENDILSQVIPYPDDLSDLTVCRPFSVGLIEDGTPRELTFRELCALVVGFRGSGKSNLMNVLIAQLGRCVDTVVFMIDLKGGRTALPWIQPWLDGKTPRPVIDWVATNREEAERMLDAVLRGIDKRAHSGSGGEKITPSASQPALILIVDELASIAGLSSRPAGATGPSNMQMAEKVTRLAQLGRSEAIDAILATQRGTVTMTGGGDLKSQCQLRIGLGVASEADARLVIPDDASVARILPKLKHKGTGIVSDNDGRLAPVKFWRIDTESSNEPIHRIAEQLGYVRPEPDPVLMAALGDDYAERWTMARAGHIPGFARMARAGAAAGTFSSPDGDYGRRFAEITSAMSVLDEDDVDEPENGMHPARSRLLELLARSGVLGITPMSIGQKLDSEGLGVARQTVHKWLAEEVEAGRATKASYGRYRAMK